MFDLETTRPATDACLPLPMRRAVPRRSRAPSRADVIRQARRSVSSTLERLGPLFSETLDRAPKAERGELITLATVVDALVRELGTRFEVCDETVLPVLDRGVALPMPDLVAGLDAQAVEIHARLRRVRALTGERRIDGSHRHLAELWVTLRELERDVTCLLAAERTIYADLTG